VELAARAGEFAATGDPLPNEMYPRLAAVAQPGYVDEKIPLHPARAARDLGNALPPGGLVTAEPGIAGLWVARTFPTPALTPGEPRRVLVPAQREAGIATQRALDAALGGRPTLAVATAPLGPAELRVFEDATRQEAPLVLVVWEPAAELGAAADHESLLRAALAAGGPSIVEVPVAFEDTQDLVAAAGDVVAWGGPDAIT